MNKRNERKTEWFWFGLSFLVPFLISLTGYIVIKVWPFGDGTVLIIDSLHQYLPFYTELNEKLRTGQSLFYDFSAGFGYNFWATIAYYMANPMNLLIALFPRAHVADFMDYMILLKIALCGATLSWYLRRRQKRPFLPLVIGTMYAMGNFIIGYYFNLMWLDSIAMLPLIMYGIEKLCEGKGGRVYGISLFYAIWSNYYIGFMLCIFSVLYLVLTFSEHKGIRPAQLGRRALVFGWYSLLAGGMASALLIPAYRSLAASESMQSNHFPSTIKFYTDFIELMASHFAHVHPMNISDTQVGLNAYCGSAVLLLVLLYFLDEKISLRIRLGRLVMTALLLLSFSMNVLNYIWHGFHQQNGLPNRFAFIYVCLLLVMVYDVIPHLAEMKLWKILACGGVCTVFVLAAVLLGKTDTKTYGGWVYLTALLLVIYTALLAFFVLRSMDRRMACTILGAVLLTESAVHGIYGFIYNDNVTRSIYLKDQASFATMMEGRNDGTFFRTEYDSQRMRNVAMYAGANSTVMFNSTMYSSVTDFCDRIGMEARTNKNGYIGVTALMNDVFGIRYRLSSMGKGDTLCQFTKIDEDGNLSLYENPDALSVGFMVRPEIRLWDIHEGTPIDVQNTFIQLAAGHEGIFVLDRTVEAENEKVNELKIPENKQVYLYLGARVDNIKVETPEYAKTYQTYTDHLYVVDGTKDNRMASFTVKLKNGQKNQTVNIYTCPDEAEKEVVSLLGKNQLTNVRVKGNRLEGSIHVDEEGILFLTVPYDRGWKVTVDGQTHDFEKIAQTFMGIELAPGDHQIAMHFVPLGFVPGLILSVLSALLFAGSVIAERKWKRRKADGEKKITFSKAANALGAGIFARLDDLKEQMKREGRTIYNLSVGTPDFEVPENVKRAVVRAATLSDNYKYALRDIPQLQDALSRYFQRRYQVRLSSEEMMSVYGSQEGMAHIAWALCDPGDVVLVPNPGYPIFKMGPQLCGARVWEYPLLPENGYLPKLQDIPEDVREAAKFMIVSYPGNPYAKAAPDSFYEELIAFARENQIIIVHDNAYSDIVFGGRRGRSFLSFEGAKEVGVEFFSLSKTFDYTGARLSFVVGNKEIVSKFRALRSQFDYGIFLPVQYGAVAALDEPEEAVLAQCAEYEQRSRTLTAGLREIGWPVEDADGTMFVWAPLPKGYTNSERFCLELMKKSGVICTPGSSFGSLGEGYVRFALVLPVQQLQEAVDAIAQSGMIEHAETESLDDQTGEYL